MALALLSATSAGAAKLTEYPLVPDSYPVTITLGPDGNMWFTEGANKVGRITPAGVMTEFPTSDGCTPYDIAAISDGNLWYACSTSPLIGRISTSGSKYEFFTFVVSGEPMQSTGRLAEGYSLHIWWGIAAGGGGGGVGRTWSDNGSQGTPLSFSPLTTAVASGIARGPGAASWVLVPPDRIYYGSESVNENGYAVNQSVTVQGLSTRSFVVQCRGWAWFTVYDANAIGRTRYSSVSGIAPPEEIILPGTNNKPSGIACGNDGSIWFTLVGSNKVARLKNDGSNTYEDFPIPTPSALPYGIAIGADGSVWFTENTGHKVGHLQLRQQGDVNGDGKIDVSDVFYLINFLFAGGQPPAP